MQISDDQIVRSVRFDAFWNSRLSRMKKYLFLGCALIAIFFGSLPAARAASGQATGPAHTSGGGGGHGFAGGGHGFSGRGFGGHGFAGRGGGFHGPYGRWEGRGYGHWGGGRYWHHRWYPGYYGLGIYGLGYPYYSDYYYPYDYPFAYYGDTPYYGYSDYPPVPAGSAEAAVQSALARRGYYRGEIDGILGPASYRAIRSFQADQGLPVTGQVDARLLRALRIG
jgi:Putative peptidoglycan binding domain